MSTLQHDTNQYWVRSHITKQELINRFTEGDKLIEDEKTHRKTEISWLNYLAERHLSKDQAQRYIRAARRFSSKQRECIANLQLPWKVVELLACQGLSDDHIERFLSLSSTKPSVDSCVMLLYKIIYEESEKATSSASTVSTKEITQEFLVYLEDTIRSMRQYLAENDKG